MPSNKAAGYEATLRVRWKGDGYTNFIINVYKTLPLPTSPTTPAEKTTPHIEKFLKNYAHCRTSWCTVDLPLGDRLGRGWVQIEYEGHAGVHTAEVEMQYIPAALTTIRLKDGTLSRMCNVNFDLGS